MAKETDIYDIDTSGAVTGLKDVAAETKRTGDATEDMASFLREDLKDSLFSAQAGYDALKGSIMAVGAFLVDSTKEYLTSAKNSAQLAHALRNAGISSEFYVNQLEDQISALERATGADGEMLKQVAMTLATMKVAPTELGRYTKAALNLAEATGQDVVMAARTLAKANAQSAEEIRSWGVEVSEAEFKAKGFTAVLEEIERRADGLSAAMPDNVKHITQATVAWGDFKKAVGEVISELLVFEIKGVAVANILEAWTEILTGKGADALTAYTLQTQEITFWSDRYAEVAAEAARDQRELNDAIARGDEFVDGYRSRLALTNKELAAIQAKLHALKGTKPEADFNLAPVKMDVKSDARLAEEKKARDEAQKQALADVFSLIFAEQEAKLRAEEQRKKFAESVQDIKDRERQKELDKEKEHADQWKAIQQDKLRAELAEWQAMQNAKKQIQDQTMQELGNYGMQVVSFGASLMRERILQHEEFNAQYRAAYIERRQMDLEEMGVHKSKAEVAQEMQNEEAAAQQARTAEVLASIAEQAAMRAVFEAAEGLSYLSNPATAPLAGGKFAAAAAFAAVAAAAGGAAKVITDNRGMTSQERSEIEAVKSRDKDRSEREAKASTGGAAGPGTTQNVYFFGTAGMTELEQAAELERLRKNLNNLRTGA